MKMERFTELMIKTVEAAMPNDVKEYATVGVREVVKSNDEKFHAIILEDPDKEVFPYVYLEDLYEQYENGTSISELAKYVVEVNTTPAPYDLKNIDFNFDNIKDKLILKIVEISRNLERIENLLCKDTGNGFALIPYIMFSKDESGMAMAAMTSGMVEEYGYDTEQIFAIAEKNTLENDEPIMCNLAAMIMNMETSNNLLKADAPTLNSNMYIFTNESTMNGAVGFFIGETQQLIAQVLGENYYMLPSSIHEVMIVPESEAPSAKIMRDMVIDINNSVVDASEILSNRIFYYNRSTGELTEPEYPF